MAAGYRRVGRAETGAAPQPVYGRFRGPGGKERRERSRFFGVCGGPGRSGPLFFSSPSTPSGRETEVGAIKQQKTRVNEQIRISPVRLVGEDGEQIGIVSVEDAREKAKERGLDLVEVAPDARPPVCKLMDYGKYKYEEARRAWEAKKKQRVMQVKEVKFRPGIEDHDYEFKRRHVRRFLEDGDKVKVTMLFRGRQMAHPERGLEVLERLAADVDDVGKVESEPTREGRTMIMVIAPLPVK